MGDGAPTPTELFEAYTGACAAALAETAKGALVGKAAADAEPSSADRAVAPLLDRVAGEWKVLQMWASGINDPVVIAAAGWPEEITAVRDQALAALFPGEAEVDQVQASLIGWVWALDVSAALGKHIAGLEKVDKEAADGTAAVFADRLLTRLLATGLTADDRDGRGADAEVSPFSTLLRQRYPKASFALSVDAASGLTEYPAPVVVDGLPESLARLCGLYGYAGQHEGKPSFLCKASGYYLYFDKTDKRWFVSPKLGDRNILCYKEVGVAAETHPCADRDLQFWDGKAWSTSKQARMTKLQDRLWAPPRGTKRPRTD